jgi:hypothetical protein
MAHTQRRLQVALALIFAALLLFAPFMLLTETKERPPGCSGVFGMPVWCEHEQ